MRFEDMLDRIKADAGGEADILPDASGTYHCLFGGYEVMFRPIEEGRLLATTVVIAALSESASSVFLARLLQASFLGLETDGAVFALDGEGRLLARRIDSVETADESFVGELVAKMTHIAHAFVSCNKEESNGTV